MNRVGSGSDGLGLLKREQRITAASEHAAHGCPADTSLIRAPYRAPASACSIAATASAVIGVKMLLSNLDSPKCNLCRGGQVELRSGRILTVLVLQYWYDKVRQSVTSHTPSNGM